MHINTHWGTIVNMAANDLRLSASLMCCTINTTDSQPSNRLPLTQIPPQRLSKRDIQTKNRNLRSDAFMPQMKWQQLVSSPADRLTIPLISHRDLHLNNVGDQWWPIKARGFFKCFPSLFILFTFLYVFIFLFLILSLLWISLWSYKLLRVVVAGVGGGGGSGGGDYLYIVVCHITAFGYDAFSFRAFSLYSFSSSSFSSSFAST